MLGHIDTSWSVRVRQGARWLVWTLLAYGVGSVAGAATPLEAGDHVRSLRVEDRARTYLVHVPPRVDTGKPTPVVLALHGAGMNGPMMVTFCGLNQTADRHGFVVVYPSGTGRGPFLTWNAGSFGGRSARGKADDVAFTEALLDDLGTVMTVDAGRVFACGMSNGAMMCYRLAAELPERIAAIAPVGGTIAIEESRPSRPVSVIHFHGTRDTLVPYERPPGGGSRLLRLLSVEESVRTWVEINGCEAEPRRDVLSKEGDALRVTRARYGGGREGSEVVLVTVEGGGHTWPGIEPPVGFIGRSTTNVSANELMWEFFGRHGRVR